MVFSYSAIIMQLAYGCMLAAALVSRNMRARLLIVIAAALIALRAGMPPGDRLTQAWMAMIIIVCGYVIGRQLITNVAVPFTPEEATMRRAIFDAIPAAQARHLIDQGWWLSASEGEVLAREGEPIATVVFLERGQAEVTVNALRVGTCSAGDLIGEATALTGEPATATVVLTAPSRIWCIKAATLRDYVAANPDLGATLERSFRNALRAKLIATNRTIVDQASR